jgi:hypothetical protein
MTPEILDRIRTIVTMLVKGYGANGMRSGRRIAMR